MFQTNKRLGRGGEKVAGIKGTKPKVVLCLHTPAHTCVSTYIHTQKFRKAIIVLKYKQLVVLNYIKLKMK